MGIIKSLSYAFKVASMRYFYNQATLDKKLVNAVKDTSKDFKLYAEDLEALRQAGASPNAKDGNVLEQAVIQGNHWLISTLLSEGANIHISNEKALRTAMQNRQSETAFFLIEKGANPDAAVAYINSMPRSANTANALQWYNKAKPHIDKITTIQRATGKNPPPTHAP